MLPTDPDTVPQQAADRNLSLYTVARRQSGTWVCFVRAGVEPLRKTWRIGDLRGQ